MVTLPPDTRQRMPTSPTLQEVTSVWEFKRDLYGLVGAASTPRPRLPTYIYYYNLQ